MRTSSDEFKNYCNNLRVENHSCQIDKASNRQILEKEIVKTGKGVHENRKKIFKKKIKKENSSETFNQIRYNIKVEAVTTAKF